MEAPGKKKVQITFYRLAKRTKNANAHFAWSEEEHYQGY